jgi:hypothetical protein
MLCSILTFNVANYRQLSVIQVNGEGKVADNPKPWLKQKWSRCDTKGIYVNIFRKNDVQHLGTLC